MITGLEEKSPASRTGLKEGDIIIEFDGLLITSSGDLTRKLTGNELILKPTRIKILRQTLVKELDIIPVERPAA